MKESQRLGEVFFFIMLQNEFVCKTVADVKKFKVYKVFPENSCDNCTNAVRSVQLDD